ncbi:MAG: DoxX family protein [Rhizobiaceae bacterium]
MQDPLKLIGRVLIAALFVPAGFQTLSDISNAAGYFEQLGLPLPTLAAWSVGIFELLAGALVLVGWQTMAVASLLGLFAIVAGFLGHFGQGGDDATLRFLHSQMFWKDVAIAGGAFILAAAGPGVYSLDARRM